MAYKTPEELIAIVDEENLWFDVYMTLFVGNNNLRFSVMELPEDRVEVRDNTVSIQFADDEEPEVMAFAPVGSELEFPKNMLIYLVRDGDSFSLRIFDAEEDEKDFDRIILEDFLSGHNINTRGKLLKILKDGYRIYKDYVDEPDPFELHRDSMSAEIE